MFSHVDSFSRYGKHYTVLWATVGVDFHHEDYNDSLNKRKNNNRLRILRCKFWQILWSSLHWLHQTETRCAAFFSQLYLVLFIYWLEIFFIKMTAWRRMKERRVNSCFKGSLDRHGVAVDISRQRPWKLKM